MKCDLTNKKTAFGNNVSNSNKRTRRQFKPNVQSFTFFSKSLNGFVKVKATTSVAKTVEKLGGIDNFIKLKQNDYDTKKFKQLKEKILK